MTWTPLGERAWTLAPVAPGTAERLMTVPPAWLEEAWPCGERVAVLLSDEVARETVEAALALLASPEEPRLVEIPTVYDGADLPEAAESLGLSAVRFTELHAAQTYVCAAIGFCPGFGYLETLPPELCGLARLPSPRSRVPAGSVAVAGDRTAIYPLDRPGGWRLIGRTELPMVDVGAGLFRLRVGDRVRFVPQSVRA